MTDKQLGNNKIYSWLAMTCVKKHAPGEIQQQMNELQYLRNYINNQSLLLSKLASTFQTKFEEKANGDVSFLELVTEFKQLHAVISTVRRDAELFVQNRFERLPSDIILTIISSSCVSFGDLQQIRRTSKQFNGLIDSNEETLYKGLCLRWWNQNHDFPQLSYLIADFDKIHPLVYVQQLAQQHDPRYNWKWFGKCICRYRPLSWTLDERKKMLSLGEIDEGDELYGFGLRINGDCYRWLCGGSFFANFCDGWGHRVFENGVSVVGDIHNFAFNGDATITWPDGFKIETKWKNNEPVGKNPPG